MKFMLWYLFLYLTWWNPHTKTGTRFSLFYFILFSLVKEFMDIIISRYGWMKDQSWVSYTNGQMMEGFKRMCPIWEIIKFSSIKTDKLLLHPYKENRMCKVSKCLQTYITNSRKKIEKAEDHGWSINQSNPQSSISKQIYLWKLLIKVLPTRATQKNWISTTHSSFTSKRNTILRLERNGQAKPGVLLQCLGIDLAGDCQQRLRYDLMLEKGTQLPMIIQLRFHWCEMINSI